MDSVWSVEPSSTMMISFLGHVCLSADWIVSAIHSWALNAGMRIDTKGFMMEPPSRQKKRSLQHYPGTLNRNSIPQQFCIQVQGQLANRVPGMPFVSVLTYLLPPSVQALE